jgi:hypothetical protein
MSTLTDSPKSAPVRSPSHSVSNPTSEFQLRIVGVIAINSDFASGFLVANRPRFGSGAYGGTVAYAPRCEVTCYGDVGESIVNRAVNRAKASARVLQF